MVSDIDSDPDDRRIVYISGPYTKGAWEDNIIDVIEAAEKVFSLGHIPIIPHTMTTLWALRYPKPKERWLEIDLALLDVCDAIIRLPGESEGADIEVDYARRNGIELYMSTAQYMKEHEPV